MRNIHLPALLDSLINAGADTVYWPNFSLADPMLIRREARVRAMARGAAEATEYARNNSFTSVRRLSVEEGTSYRASDIFVTGGRVMPMAPPRPPPPVALSSAQNSVVAPGQIETQVLSLLYRMER